MLAPVPADPFKGLVSATGVEARDATVVAGGARLDGPGVWAAIRQYVEHASEAEVLRTRVTTGV